MTWASVQGDWNGFLDVVRQRAPCVDLGRPGGIPAISMSSFCSDIARHADVTVAEAEELVETLFLPAWLNRKIAVAAE